jgi:hypothetical protein
MKLTTEEPADPLHSNATDHSVAIAKSVFGAVPIAGPFFCELIGIIPGQRNDRLADYARSLDERLSNVEQLTADARDGLAPERVRLFEEGGLAAQRSTSAERIERIARIVAEGLLSDEKKAMDQARVLRLLASIDDYELALLIHFASTTGQSDILDSLVPSGDFALSFATSDDGGEVVDEETVRRIAFRRLSQLDLVVRDSSKISLDDLESREPNLYRLSREGRYFLRAIGAASGGE